MKKSLQTWFMTVETGSDGFFTGVFLSGIDEPCSDWGTTSCPTSGFLILRSSAPA
jgi:hypothetical protein